MAGHGRTGTFLASLIALLEDDHTTPDPIAAVRERHCEQAVESVAQGEAIFALRGQPLPRKYRRTLWAPRPIQLAARS
jgi:protein-tyrosine phosphatase